MNGRTFVLILASAVAIQMAASLKVRAAFTFDDLLNLIELNQVQTVEQTIPLLPDELKSAYAAVYRSNSLQEASPRNPRILLYGEDAKLIISFNGSPSQRGHDALEVMSYRDESRSFEFREIRFIPEPSRKRFEVSAPNPDKCTGCHLTDARPNWENAFLWPGAFGAQDDQLTKNDSAKLAHFEAGRAYGIYSSLPAFIESPQRNRRLSQAIGKLNSQRIARKIRSDINLRPFRYALLGVLTCSFKWPVKISDHPHETDFLFHTPVEAFFPDSFQFQSDFSKELEETNFQQRSALEIQLAVMRWDGETEWLSQTQDAMASGTMEETSRVAAIRFVLRQTEVDISDWSTSINPYSFTFNEGGQSFRNLDEILWKDLLEPSVDQTLSFWFEQRIISNSELFSRDVETHRQGCDELARKSRSTLSYKHK